MPDKAIKSNAAIKSAAKGAGIVFIGIFLSKFLSYLYRAIVARIGPEQYGMLSIGLAVIGIISFFPLCGLDLGVVRFVSFYKGKNDSAELLIKDLMRAGADLCKGDATRNLSEKGPKFIEDILMKELDVNFFSQIQ